MTQADFDTWVELAASSYAEDITRARGEPLGETTKRAWDQLPTLLPQRPERAASL